MRKSGAVAHSEVPHPGKWRTLHTNNGTWCVWIPDLLAMAKAPPSETRLTKSIRASTPEREAQIATKAKRWQVCWEFV